jgi:UDP-glucoronosyl and UDP-glucosyl transferase
MGRSGPPGSKNLDPSRGLLRNSPIANVLRTMARICIVPWPEWGHTMPPLRVASDLIQRGHHVSMIVPRSFTDRVEAAGIEAVWWRNERYSRAHAMTRSAEGVGEFEAGDRILTECVADDTEGGMLRELLERGRYDLILADALIPATVVVAWALGVPCMQTADGLPVDNVPMAPDRDARVRASIAREAEFLRDYVQKNPALASFEEFVDEAGYKPEWIDRDDLCAGTLMKTAVGKPLLFCPPALSMAPPVGERFHFCQSLPEPGPEPWAPRASASKTICLSFGNYAARYPDAPKVAACLIASMARVPDMEMIVLAFPPRFAGRLPRIDNVRFVGFVDQRRLLNEGVRLMCTHGGLGSTKESVYSGTPMFLTPFWFDQPRNGEMVQFLGMGSHVSPGASVDEICDTFLETLGSVEMLARAAEVSARVRDFERQTSGADVIEDVLRPVT